MKTILILLVIVILWQFVCWLIYGHGGQDDDERVTWKQRRADLRRQWTGDARVVMTTIDTSRVDKSTASGSAEYSRTIREGHDYGKDYR